MSRFISQNVNDKIANIMFADFGATDTENFLKNELARYIPQMIKKSDEDIKKFVEYQRGVYLEGKLPIFGKPIASLNPTFVDGVDSIKMKKAQTQIYTRASVKENGYRMQLHISHNAVNAFTRQFTSYDLRMFPELAYTLASLPVMIGDCELINKNYKHLAGFNRVQLRIPGIKYWPKAGSNGLNGNLIEEYLTGPCFKNDKPIADLEMTLAFHGMIAIAPPSTWHQPRIIQYYSILNTTKLPVDYERIDEILDELQKFIEEKKLNARVVERKVVKSKKELGNYVAKKDAEGLEGVCVVQSARDANGTPIVISKSVKIKKYETIDTALLGVYLNKKADGLIAENTKAILLGLYDASLGMYLPAFKANLDPTGPQIKTAGQRERLVSLRDEVVQAAASHVDYEATITTLYDVYLHQGKRLLESFLKKEIADLKKMLAEIPRSNNFETILMIFRKEYTHDRDFNNTPAERKFIDKYESILTEIIELADNQIKRICKYFNEAKAVKQLSAKLIKPSMTLSTVDPIVVESRVFDIKWGACPYPAGFHSWYANSFHFNNVYAERIRYDKDTTTDYTTIYELARTFTVKKK